MAEILRISDKEYHEISDRCSASAIKGKFRKSPAHYKAAEQKRSPALSFGNLAHTVVLQTPHEFRERYTYIPSGSPKRPTQRQIEAKNPSEATLKAISFWKLYDEQNKDKESITNEDRNKAIEMKLQINRHKIAKSIIDGADEIEIYRRFFIFPYGIPLIHINFRIRGDGQGHE